MTDRLDTILAYCEKATKGPWKQDEYENWRVGGNGRWVAYCGPEPPDPNPRLSERDATFIANARTDLPWAIERIRELERQRDELTERYVKTAYLLRRKRGAAMTTAEGTQMEGR